MIVSHQQLTLSESQSGLPIPIASTTSPGNVIHSTIDDDQLKDTLWVWAFNNSNDPVTLTIVKRLINNDWVDNIIEIPPKSNKVLIEPGIILVGGASYRAYASVTNVIHITGYVVRRSESAT